MKKKTLILVLLMALAYSLHLILNGFFDTKISRYENIKQIEGGWLPVEENLLTGAKNIKLTRNLDTNDYFFIFELPANDLNKIKIFLDKNSIQSSVLDCSNSKIEICKYLNTKEKLSLYNLNNKLVSGHTNSFWVFKNELVILSNLYPVSEDLLK